MQTSNSHFHADFFLAVTMCYFLGPLLRRSSGAAKDRTGPEPEPEPEGRPGEVADGPNCSGAPGASGSAPTQAKRWGQKLDWAAIRSLCPWRRRKHPWPVPWVVVTDPDGHHQRLL